MIIAAEFLESAPHLNERQFHSWAGRTLPTGEPTVFEALAEMEIGR